MSRDQREKHINCVENVSADVQQSKELFVDPKWADTFSTSYME